MKRQIIICPINEKIINMLISYINYINDIKSDNIKTKSLLKLK